MPTDCCFDRGWGCWNMSLLERELPYIAELGEYLREKSFYYLDTYLSGDQDTESCVSIPNVTPQFGNSVILPWILKWHAQNRGDSVAAPTVKYAITTTEMHLMITFSPLELETIKRYTMSQRELDERAAREGWEGYF